MIRKYDKSENIKKANQRLNEGTKNKKGPIDVDKLIKYAEAISLICDGEYGDTYYHEEDNNIFICLGDSNPFDTEFLEWIMRDAIKTSYDVSDDDIDIEIENECGPSGEGWKRIRNGKLIDN